MVPRLCYAGIISWINSLEKETVRGWCPHSSVGLGTPTCLASLQFAVGSGEVCVLRNAAKNCQGQPTKPSYLQVNDQSLLYSYHTVVLLLSLWLLPLLPFQTIFLMDSPTPWLAESLHPYSLHCTFRENLFAPWIGHIIYSALSQMVIILSSSGSLFKSSYLWSESERSHTLDNLLLLPTHFGYKTLFLSLLLLSFELISNSSQFNRYFSIQHIVALSFSFVIWFSTWIAHQCTVLSKWPSCSQSSAHGHMLALTLSKTNPPQKSPLENNLLSFWFSLLLISPIPVLATH